MKKLIFSLLFPVLFAHLGQAQSLSQLAFKKLNGDSVRVSSFAGKKVLFFIAPLSPSDSNFVQLKAFKERYKDTVQVVCIVSLEDGYKAAHAKGLQAQYDKMGVVLTEAMYTRKTSGKEQSELMKWLTDRTKNTHFDMDSKGIGHKFFITESGRLFAVLPPQAPLTAAIIDNIVHSKSRNGRE
jgi:glutathione peroxidase-family protein